MSVILAFAIAFSACALGAARTSQKVDLSIAEPTLVATENVVGRAGSVDVVQPAGTRAQICFELSGEVVNPVVDGRLFEVSLAGPDERLVCRDGHSWVKTVGGKEVAKGDVTNALSVVEEGVSRIRIESARPMKAVFAVSRKDVPMPVACAGVSNAADEYIAAARKAYVAVEYASYTNSIAQKYAKTIPNGFRADLPHEGSTVRWIDVEGTKNFRDIGGWTGLATGLVYRGAELNCRTDAKRFHNLLATKKGLRTLADLGIKTDLDLRGRAECLRPDETPIPGATLFRCTSSAYTNMLKSAKNLAKAVRVFADRNNYPIYFHCYGGADRTGTLAMVVEGLCGVAEEDLSIDYELTSFGLGLRSRVDKPYWFASAIAWFKRREGATLADKIAGYLIRDCGMTEAEIASIRAILAPARRFQR